MPGLAVLLVILLESNLALLTGLLHGNALVGVRGGVHDDGGQEHEVPKGGDGARSEQGLVVRRRRGDEVRPSRLVRVGADQFLHEAHGGYQFNGLVRFGDAEDKNTTIEEGSGGLGDTSAVAGPVR